MARLRILQPEVTATWPPELFTGASQTSASATSLRYDTVAGYQVVLTGRSFVYDSDGVAVRGTVDSISVRTDAGVEVLQVSSVAARLDTLLRFAFGPLLDDGSRGAADGAAFLAHLLRGADTVYGSAGDDSLFGSGSGWGGDDLVYGGGGNDVVFGDIGNDRLFGGAGSDLLSYQTSFSDPFADQGIVMDLTAKTVRDCWGGLDSISGFQSFGDSAFDDTITGSLSDETFQLTAGRDILDAGQGQDWLDYSTSAALGGRLGIRVDLALNTVRDAFGDTDTVSNLEGVGGTSRADVFLGDGGANNFEGRQGLDRFDGRGGFDRVGFWDVARLGGTGVVIDMSLTTGQIVNDGFGNVEKVTSIEAFTLSGLADSFVGSLQTDNVNGGAGNDSIYGGAGEDYLYGDAGDDLVFGGADRNHLYGGTGQDELTGGARDDDFVFLDYGAANADIIHSFNFVLDQIMISVAWGGLTEGDLDPSAFRSGSGVTTAINGSQRVLYDTATGTLYFDRDGAGGVAAEVFAVLDNHAALAAADFLVLG